MVLAYAISPACAGGHTGMANRASDKPRDVVPERVHLFDSELSVSADDLEIELRSFAAVAWSDFLLNPRRLRGSDFLMRWSQGRWSEDRIIQAVNDAAAYYAIPYGPSSTAPDEDVREFELYFERLEAAGLRNMKRPDILIFPGSDRKAIERLVEGVGGLEELPFIPEDDDSITSLVSKAIVAVECENSLWKVRMMPDYGAELAPQRRLNGRLGLKKSAKVPTIILKEEDRDALRAWQDSSELPIHVWHVFYDQAYGLSLDDIEKLISSGLIEPTQQTFQAPNAAVTTKTIYKVWYQYAYRLGQSAEEPTLVADSITDPNGRIMPYVRFDGGRLTLSREAGTVLDELAATRAGRRP